MALDSFSEIKMKLIWKLGSYIVFQLTQKKNGALEKSRWLHVEGGLERRSSGKIDKSWAKFDNIINVGCKLWLLAVATRTWVEKESDMSAFGYETSFFIDEHCYGVSERTRWCLMFDDIALIFQNIAKERFWDSTIDHILTVLSTCFQCWSCGPLSSKEDAPPIIVHLFISRMIGRWARICVRLAAFRVAAMDEQKT